MTRDYAAQRLLALGPLMREEFDAITGWPAKECRLALRRLQERGIARSERQRGRRTVWRLRRGGGL